MLIPPVPKSPRGMRRNRGGFASDGRIGMALAPLSSAAQPSA
jgi:hypothetical protein